VAQAKRMMPMLLVGFVAACGASAHRDEPVSGDGPCWGLVAPMSDPESHSEHACNAILEHRTNELDATVGPYARGDVPVYTGTVIASDSLGGELTGEAKARIVRDQNVGVEVQGPGVLLQIVVPGSDRWLTIAQADADTEILIVGTVLPWDSWGGVQPTTAAAGVRLADSPGALELDLEAERVDELGTRVTVSVDLHLERLAPNDIDVPLLLEFPGPIPTDFEVVGEELRRRISHENGIGYAAVTPSDYQGTGACGYGPEYSIEQFVKLDDLSTHGVRGAVLHDNAIYCGSCQSDACTWDYEKRLGAK
jgi:hypothetical protein